MHCYWEVSQTVYSCFQLKQIVESLCAGEGSRQLGASTRQAVLIAVSALGTTLGPTHPKPFISVLPAIVAAAKDVHRSVRSSALASAASCLAALASAALPLLPKLVPAVLAAAQTAVDRLAASSSEVLPQLALHKLLLWSGMLCCRLLCHCF